MDSTTKRWAGEKGAVGIFSWLLDCYERTLIEDRLTNAKKGWGGGKAKKEFLAKCRECILSHTALLQSEVQLFDFSYHDKDIM